MHRSVQAHSEPHSSKETRPLKSKDSREHIYEESDHEISNDDANSAISSEQEQDSQRFQHNNEEMNPIVGLLGRKRTERHFPILQQDQASLLRSSSKKSPLNESRESDISDLSPEKFIKSLQCSFLEKLECPVSGTTLSFGRACENAIFSSYTDQLKEAHKVIEQKQQQSYSEGKRGPKKAVNPALEPEAPETPKVIKIIEYESEKSKYIMPPLYGPSKDYTTWDLEHLLNLWKQGPQKYRQELTSYYMTPGATTLYAEKELQMILKTTARTQKHTPLEEVKEDNPQMDNWEIDLMRLPFQRFGLIQWSYLRDSPNKAFSLCDFSEWEGKYSSQALKKGAKKIFKAKGPAFSLAQGKPWQDVLKSLLSSQNINHRSFKIAVLGPSSCRQSMYQCKLCAKYVEGKKTMIKHLSFCVNPLRRLDFQKYTFPKNKSDLLICVVCDCTKVNEAAMMEHIIRNHANHIVELDAWGYDYDLICAQFDAWAKGSKVTPKKRKQKNNTM